MGTHTLYSYSSCTVELPTIGDEILAGDLIPGVDLRPLLCCVLIQVSLLSGVAISL